MFATLNSSNIHIIGSLIATHATWMQIFSERPVNLEHIRPLRVK